MFLYSDYTTWQILAQAGWMSTTPHNQHNMQQLQCKKHAKAPTHTLNRQGALHQLAPTDRWWIISLTVAPVLSLSTLKTLCCNGFFPEVPGYQRNEYLAHGIPVKSDPSWDHPSLMSSCKEAKGLLAECWEPWRRSTILHAPLGNEWLDGHKIPS